MYQQFSKIMSHLQDPFLFAIRIFWGFKILRAGVVKLEDLTLTSKQFAAMGVTLPLFLAIVIGLLETLGGFSLMIGFGTQFFALLIALIMGSAYLFEHQDALESFSTLPLVDGIDALMKPYHFLFLFPMIILLAAGPGRISLEWLWFRKRVPSMKRVFER